MGSDANTGHDWVATRTVGRNADVLFLVADADTSVLSAGTSLVENAFSAELSSLRTIRPMLGALGANVEGKRLAGAHLVFNVITGTIAIVLIKPFAQSVDAISEALGIAADKQNPRVS